MENLSEQFADRIIRPIVDKAIEEKIIPKVDYTIVPAHKIGEEVSELVDNAVIDQILIQRLGVPERIFND